MPLAFDDHSSFYSCATAPAVLVPAAIYELSSSSSRFATEHLADPDGLVLLAGHFSYRQL